MLRYSIFLFILVLVTPSVSSALTIDQKKVLDSGVYYFNTEEGCTTSPSVNLSGGSYGTDTEGGATNIQKVQPAPFSGGTITPTGVMLHWTGGNPNQSVESFVAGMNSRDLSVQLYIDGSGNVYQLVDKLDTHTSHAGNANAKTIGIEIAAGSDGTVATSEEEINANSIQKQAVARTVKYIVDTFGMQTAPDLPNYRGILSHHLVDPGRKSDVGDAYHQEIVRAVESGGQLAIGGSDTCSPSAGGGSGGDPEANKTLGQQVAAERGFTGSEYACLLELWTRESGWASNAINDSPDAWRDNSMAYKSDVNKNHLLDEGETIPDNSEAAYGIPQAKPGVKMATVGDDWRTNARVQITWGLDYIEGRYRTPCGALAHSDAKGWY